MFFAAREINLNTVKCINSNCLSYQLFCEDSWSFELYSWNKKSIFVIVTYTPYPDQAVYIRQVYVTLNVTHFYCTLDSHTIDMV